MKSSDEVVIRPAGPADLEPIVELTWAVAAEGRWIGTEVPFDRCARREALAGTLAGPASTLFAADAGPAGGPSLVGCISIRVAPYGVADIGMMIAEGWRGRGIGRSLLETAIAWAPGAGAHKMGLEVWPHNEAGIRLYRRCGFVEEGLKARHYRRRNGELWDSVLMGRPLP